MPIIRQLVKKYKKLPVSEVIPLLHSRYHEERLFALIMLVEKFAKADEDLKDEIYQLYLNNTSYINNWDLVDSSACYIVGPYLYHKHRQPLYDLAISTDLWQRRIAMMSTFYMIKQHDFQDALKIAEILLHDKEDLIHKVAGWMLREIGNRNLAIEEDFLLPHYKNMPRTMLRYAIEKFPKEKRQAYLHGEI